MALDDNEPRYGVTDGETFWSSAADLGIDAEELDRETESLRYRLERAPYFRTYRVPPHQSRVTFEVGPGGITYRVFFWFEGEGTPGQRVVLAWIDEAHPEEEEDRRMRDPDFRF